MDIYYHTDENCRKGCHVVSEKTRGRGGQIVNVHLFSIDEPGAWWDDCWNVHVDGCDYKADSKLEAIYKGMRVRGKDLGRIIDAGAYYAN